jgi:DNA-binding response OmpR family regulator
MLDASSAALTLHESGRAVYVRGRWIRLGPRQGVMLRALMQTPGKVVPLSRLASLVWGHQVPRTLINVHIHYLRKKIEIDADRPKILLTLPGAGFVVDPRAAGALHG